MFIHCENDKCSNYFEDSCSINLNEGMVSLDNTGRCVSFEKGISGLYNTLDKKEIYKLTKIEALDMLSDNEYIHTFRDSDIALVGADWTREEMLEMINTYQFELSGENATKMGHGMAFQDELGWIFVETK